MKDARATYRTSVEVGDGYKAGLIYDLPGGVPAAVEQVFAPGNIVRAALLVVQKWINEQLWAHTGPSLLYEPRKDHLNLRIIPKNLMGAMCLQFARSIDGNKDYRQWRQCGKWFEISIEANRPTKFFCPDGACRSKFYRGRVKATQKLPSEGVSIKEIAERLEADVTTVQGWVARPARNKTPSSQVANS